MNLEYLRALVVQNSHLKTIISGAKVENGKEQKIGEARKASTKDHGRHFSPLGKISCTFLPVAERLSLFGGPRITLAMPRADLNLLLAPGAFQWKED